jgi:trehalose 6-phosphate phosphatase
VTQALERVRAVLDGALVALDFDGTLAVMHDDPDAVRLVEGGREALHALARRGARVAIVTGRPVATVFRLASVEDVPGLVVHGVYGAEIWAGGQLRTPPTPSAMAAARQDAQSLIDSVQNQPGLRGAWLEDKRISVVVHTRRAADPAAAQALLSAPVGELAARHGLECHPGKDGLEVRLPGLDKGTAVRAMLDDDPTAALYAGDDLGDVPAMEEVAAWGRRTGRPAATIASGAAAGSPVAAAAGMVLPGPPEVIAALNDLL